MPRDHTAPEGWSFIFTSQLSQFKGEPQRLRWRGHLELFFFSFLQELFKRQQCSGEEGGGNPTRFRRVWGASVDKQDGERERRSHGGVSVGLNLWLF